MGYLILYNEIICHLSFLKKVYVRVCTRACVCIYPPKAICSLYLLPKNALLEQVDSFI